MKKTQTPRKTLAAGITRVLKRLHFPLEVMLLCVRWHVAYSLSLRNLEEMMAERGIEVDHSTVHRRVIKLVPLFEKTFRKHKQPVGNSWRMDETYIKVKGSPLLDPLALLRQNPRGFRRSLGTGKSLSFSSLAARRRRCHERRIAGSVVSSV
ncbi:hypothetical protein HDG38_002621 [Paraburkholderia sp. WSM4177]|nr:hypothetical protein [Paraburkholderia sp. WSM4177]MBB5485587.1 hypothetical protein [Paraburkholderia sp. WSM4180]